MTTTILFFWVVAQGFLAAPQTIEFDDAKACTTALEQLRVSYAKTQAYAMDVAGVCAPKTSPVGTAPTCTFTKAGTFCTSPSGGTVKSVPFGDGSP